MPAALSARARLFDSGRKDKTDPYDARSAAIVALRHHNLRAVELEDQRQVLRLLARRHHQFTAGRTRAICRLHAVLCEMIEGGLSKNLSAKRAASELRKLRPHHAIGIERKRIAVEFLDEVRRIDRALDELRGRIDAAVNAARTSVTDVFGVGPIVACYLIGHTGDVRRFPSAGHYARYNATAPIEASSGPKIRHRLNPNGNRHLNHAVHIVALGQISHDTSGRAYYLANPSAGARISRFGVPDCRNCDLRYSAARQPARRATANRASSGAARPRCHSTCSGLTRSKRPAGDLGP